MKNETVQTRLATQGQIKDIHATLIQGVPELTFEQAEGIIKDKSALVDKVRGFFTFSQEKGKPTNLQLSEWSSLYKEMGITLDVENLTIPEHEEGFNRLIIVAKGMTQNRAFDECKKRFSSWKYTEDLDTAVPTNDRSPQNGTYAIWVRDRVEADEELKNKSANDLKTPTSRALRFWNVSSAN